MQRLIKLAIAIAVIAGAWLGVGMTVQAEYGDVVINIYSD